jgi:hypothetical protein
MNPVAYMAIALLLAAREPQVPPTKPPAGVVQDLVARSQFIFKGHVVKPNASNVKAVASSNRTAVVRVEEVLDAPSTLGDYTGQEITVQLSQPSRLVAGQEALFFTVGWVYGETLAVKEVGRLAGAAAAADTARKQIADARRRADDTVLGQRIRASQFVVAGKVATTGPLGDRGPDTRGTEHDPEWQVAVIDVGSVEWGQAPSRTVSVLFPASRDVMWARSPKFQPGQAGIWLLHRERLPRIAAAAPPFYTALEPLDFHPPAALDRVRRIVKSLR